MPEHVVALRFGAMSSESVLADSNIRVMTDARLAASGEPVDGGVNDRRTGASRNGDRCAVCMEPVKHCVGHPGHYELLRPCYQPLFRDTVVQWLKIVCFKCSRPRAAIPPASGPTTLSKLVARLTVKPGAIVNCPHCQAPAGVIQVGNDQGKRAAREDHYKIRYAPPGWKEPPPARGPAARGAREAREAKEARQPPLLDTREAARVLDGVTAEDVAALLGGKATHPRRFMMRYLHVSPISIRPITAAPAGAVHSANAHDATQMLAQIIAADLKAREESDPRELQHHLLAVQETIHMMIMGVGGSRQQRGVGSTQGIVQRHQGKTGRHRLNLQGKRSRYMSRSVLAGDQQLRVDEVGLPVWMARKLLVAETVTSHNLAELTALFENGSEVYPGCERIDVAAERRDGGAATIKGVDVFRQRGGRLEVGDVVWRHTRNGDICIFNRQPSLKKSAMAGYKVVVLLDANTIKLNVAACSLHNADFDGDAGNNTVIHGLAARIDALVLSRVAVMVIGTDNGTPAIEMVQDDVQGIFVLTRGAFVAAAGRAMRLFSNTYLTPPSLVSAVGAAEEGAAIEGREVVSRFYELHAPVSLRRASTWGGKRDAEGGSAGGWQLYRPDLPRAEPVHLRNGRIVGGVLDKATVAASAGGVVHQVARDRGPDAALELVFDQQKIALNTLDMAGFSTGADDMRLPAGVRARLREIVAARRLRARQLVDDMVAGRLVPPIGMTHRDFFEAEIIQRLKAPDELLGAVVGALDLDRNGLLNMIGAGSKGKSNNIQHIMGAICQVTINGSRVLAALGADRTTVYHLRWDVDPASGGFVAGNYIQGLSPSEFIWSAMNGRFDLITKALSTATTGYQMRRAMMLLQSAVVSHLFMVVKNHHVTQWVYGDNGYDPRRVEKADFPTLRLDDDELAEGYFAPGKTATGDKKLAAALARAHARIADDRDRLRASALALEAVDFDRPLSTTRPVAVDTARILRNVQDRLESGDDTIVHEGARGMGAKLQMTEEACDALVHAFINSQWAEHNPTKIPAHIRNAVWLQAMHIRLTLAPAVLDGISEEAVGRTLATVVTMHRDALCAPGTAAGVSAAQAVGEMLTQYMLDSPHRSVAGGTSGAGAEDVERLLKATARAKDKGAKMLLALPDATAYDPAAAQAAASMLEHLKLSDFVTEHALLLEPFSELVGTAPRSAAAGPAADDMAEQWVAADRAWARGFAKGARRPPAGTTPWCVRLVLNRTKLLEKSMDMEELVTALGAGFPHAYLAYSTPATRGAAEHPVLRAYLTTAALVKLKGESASAHDVFELRAAAAVEKLLKTRLRGVPGLTNARVVETDRNVLRDGKVVSDRAVPANGVHGNELGQARLAVEISGTNLVGAMLHPAVDATRAITTSVDDTLRTLGVAAARGRIISSLNKFMESAAPDECHVQIYAHEMTRPGHVIPTELRGVIAAERTNVPLQMTMEAPGANLRKAALNNVRSSIYGVAGPLMMGYEPSVGSNFARYELDDEFVQNNVTNIHDDVEDLLGMF